MELSDLSGVYLATMFEDVAVKILGKSAQQLGRLYEKNVRLKKFYYQSFQSDRYSRVFEKIRFKTFNCRIRANREIYKVISCFILFYRTVIQGQEGIKWTVLDMKPVQHDTYMRSMKKAIDKFDAVSMYDDDF